MLAKSLMVTHIATVKDDLPVEDLCDVLQAAHVNGLPVLNDGGELVGIVTEQDVLYGTMGGDNGDGHPALLVRDIMTSPAVCATGDTDVVELCRLMWGMRIHRIPIVSDGRFVGMVSSLDLVRAVAEGALRP
ncbi:MAG TPA: CBS domain-containing protein [Candidatus Polarisedimenticolaceae bacterium]|nr:CBS domain-containing protein [Candidatus Polarisedimenticolaceae bacterium]